jgi:biopolymer transport protein ExbD
MRRRKRRPQGEAELDITAFMNLMIVLVPVLLLGMVFSQITVIDVQIPDSSTGADQPLDEQQLELLIRRDYLRVDYPRGVELKRIEKKPGGGHDFEMLSLVLQEVKRQLREKGIERDAITVLAEADTDYQTIVNAMDTVRSFKAMVAAEVVDAALFPQIAFGDAPAGGAR